MPQPLPVSRLRRDHAAQRAAFTRRRAAPCDAIMRRRALRSCGAMRCVCAAPLLASTVRCQRRDALGFEFRLLQFVCSSAEQLTLPFEHHLLLVLIVFMYHRFSCVVLFTFTQLSPLATSSHAAMISFQRTSSTLCSFVSPCHSHCPHLSCALPVHPHLQFPLGPLPCKND